MDTSMPDADSAQPGAEDSTRMEHDQEEPQQTSAPPPKQPSSDTELSSAPPTDSEPKKSDTEMTIAVSQPAVNTGNTSSNEILPAQAAGPISQPSVNVPEADTMAGAATTTSGADSTMSMATPTQFAIPAVPASGSANSTPRGRGGRPPGRPRLSTNGGPTHSDSAIAKTENGTPVSGRGRGRGRGGGRPRGSGRGRGAARGGKRKRGDDDDDEDGDASDSSVEITPVATATRSGRSVQKPTTFVPPPPSPITNTKRKRAYNHRNPQAAVCKVCLRGSSPASNPVVFCDGCNAPYHRWCHKPPIEQAVIEKEDAEWYCQQCAAARVVPVPVVEVKSFCSVQGASEDQRRKYFSSLPQGMLITLLVKATTFRPDLPVFSSTFRDELLSNSDGAPSQPLLEGKGKEPAGGNGEASTVPSRANSTSVPPRQNGNGPTPDDAGYTSDVHPENYPRPGQGLMSTLPPETEDLDWLVDDENDNTYGTFTHLYHEPAKAGAAVHSGDGLV